MVRGGEGKIRCGRYRLTKRIERDSRHVRKNGPGGVTFSNTRMASEECSEATKAHYMARLQRKPEAPTTHISKSGMK